MGNENSSLIDEHTAPIKLSDRSLSAVARYIKAGHAQKIVVMTGAGLSTAAGSMLVVAIASLNPNARLET